MPPKPNTKDSQAKTPVDEASPPGGEGSVLRQIFAGGLNAMRAEVQTVIGVFNPKIITTDTRLLMRLDPMVAFGLAILRAPIVNLRWSIQSKDEEIASFVKEVMSQCYTKLALAASQAIGLGFQLCEKVWKVEEIEVEVTDKTQGGSNTSKMPNAWTYEKFKAIDPRTIWLNIDDKDNFVSVEQSDFANMLGKKIVVPAEKVVLWSYRKEEAFGRLTGFPHLDHTYEPWWWKVALNLFANRYFERKADPPIKARTEAEIQLSGGKKADGFAYMGNQLAVLRNGGAFLLPNSRDSMGNYRFEAEYLEDDKRGDMFQQRFDYLDTQILRSLWVTDRAGTTNSSGMGSHALASVHAETMAESLETMVNEYLADVVNTQVINPLVLYNFGEERAKLSKTRMVSSGLTGGMKSILKDVLMALLQAEQTMMAGEKGARLSELLNHYDIAEQLGLPLNSPEEIQQIVQDRQKAQEEAMQQLQEQQDQVSTPQDEKKMRDSLTKMGAVSKNKSPSVKKGPKIDGKRNR